MKKFISVVLIGILVLGGLGAGAISTNYAKKQQTIVKNETMSVLFTSQPRVSEKDGFVEITVNGATTQLLEKNRPVLPVYVKTYQIPFGSTDISVVCNPKNIGTLTLTKEVIPTRVVLLSKLGEQTNYVKDPAVYGSAALYPNDWFSYDLGAGRNENDRQVTFVKVVCYPVRYSPANNEVAYAGGFDIQVTYTEPQTKPRSFAVTYDMVVIAPKKFQSTLQPLMDFKNTKGVVTMFKSMEDILKEYTGYDQPEKVKKFIQYAYDNWNITYVLLAGGLKNHIFAKDKDTISAGWKAWWVPVRYVSIPEQDDEGCLCDLYYGCLYNGTGGFDNWDSNGDGVYAAWGLSGVSKDKFDMNPEVYVSRLPVANTWELKRIVDKILTYESTGPAAKPWYKNFVGISGKSFYTYEGKPDGEYLVDLAYNYTKAAIPDLNQVRVYSSNRDTGGLVPNKDGISSAFNQGAGFVDMEGHGSPAVWDTIWFDGEYDNGDWVGGIQINQFTMIKNKEKLPVVLVGGCHNAMYNISTLSAIFDVDGNSYFMYGYPAPACFCYGLLLKPVVSGGAIASIGATGYGLGTSSGDPVIWTAELDNNFFYQIGQGATHVAQAHSQAITKYINDNAITQTDAFCITNWALLGDPSLLFGGYSS
jgi:hypothetical protein